MPEVPPVMKIVLPVRFMSTPSLFSSGLDAWMRGTAISRVADESELASYSAGFAVGRIGGEGFGEIFGLRGIGIELEDTGDVGAGFVELAGVASDVGEVHADGAAARRTIKGGIPQRDSAIVVTVARLDNSEVCSGVDHRGIG